MKYISTRGNAPALNFEDVTLTGLAEDGGLYVPEVWPEFSSQELREMRGLSYRELAAEVLLPFVGDSLTRAELTGLINNAYDSFEHSAIAPIKQLDDNLLFMELFHGPTLAFKDFALQFLGKLFDFLLTRRGERCTIVGATSGDTGSAAIEAVRGLPAVELFMLHPNGRVSDVQRKQMTSVQDANIHNIALNGHFDDCQNQVKAMFNDLDFRREMRLSAVNSINWARIAAQVVYYFRAGLLLGAPDREVSFSVPTGNFGNIFAAFVAHKMGLPVRQFMVGSNRNDILTRFFERGEMTQKGVEASLSPSMDIQISSNFERFLFEMSGRDSALINRLMDEFSQTGEFAVSPELFQTMSAHFSAHQLSDAQTQADIKAEFARTGEIIDPHSIIGISAARALNQDPAVPVVAMGTAHPAKFGDAVEAVIGQKVPFPARLEKVMDAEEKVTVLDNDLAGLQAFIRERV